ncbi:tol-pal system protein YbgF [Undibacterium sp. FT137W]|uniref:Cell division coordinator CpoB n=1 Tax=Undibacterium fentianense TaxID=2828728 RepID=A0A941IDA1_9BURK|nr:tol-pal system protein YbgF [Undibacterium fentianense]
MSKFSDALRAALFAIAIFPSLASAGLLDDDEARKAILKLRADVAALTARLDARIDEKADKNSALELNNQNEQLRAELTNLRGQLEVLLNDVANLQKRQQDFYTDLDKRIRALEPKKLSVDGREVTIEQSEQRSYDAAMSLYKAGQYANAVTAFGAFTMNYGDSVFASQAQYWLANSYYAQRDCKNTIAALQTLLKNYPDSSKAPDALLNISACQLELKDKKESRKTLILLMSKYPGTEAAQAAKSRLTAIK